MLSMDPYAPIAGISLERYAELGAELDGVTDDAGRDAKLAELGVSPADFQAAMDGWTARMQDMSLMGQVAQRYGPLYNAALAKKKGTASVSFEDFCAMSAAMQVFGYEGMMGHYNVSMGDWTTISAHWQTELSRDPINLATRKNQLQEQEAQRLRAGGQPKEAHIDRRGPGAPVAGGATAFDPAAQGAMQMQAAQAQNAQWMAQAAGAMNQGAMGAMMKMAGGMNALAGGSNLIAGRQVMVEWSDGNKYPATLMQNNGAQSQITFPNGQNMWVETRFLSPA